MALRIKLSRIGRTNDPKYRIIVSEAKTKRNTKYVDKIGFYDPIPNPYVLQVDTEKLTYWLSKGAQLTEGTSKLLKKHAKTPTVSS